MNGMRCLMARRTERDASDSIDGNSDTRWETLRRRIEYIWVNRLTNLKAADFDQLF